MALEPFGDIHDEKFDNQDFEDCSLHPDNDTVLRFLKRPKEDGSFLIAVLSASNSDKAVMFPNSSGNSSSFKQPDKLRVLRDFKLEMLLGRFLTFLHPSKFSKTSFSKCPIDSWTSTKLEQPSSISISKCGTRKKFGDLVRYLELLRLKTFNLLSICHKKISLKRKTN